MDDECMVATRVPVVLVCCPVVRAWAFVAFLFVVSVRVLLRCVFDCVLSFGNWSLLPGVCFLFVCLSVGMSFLLVCACVFLLLCVSVSMRFLLVCVACWWICAFRRTLISSRLMQAAKTDAFCCC